MGILEWLERRADKKAKEEFDAGFGYAATQLLYRGANTGEVLAVAENYSESFEDGAVAAISAIQYRHAGPKSIEAHVAINSLPDWPEIWAMRDEDGTVWVHPHKPEKTIFKSDYSEGWEHLSNCAMCLCPPQSFDPYWKSSPVRIR